MRFFPWRDSDPVFNDDGVTEDIITALSRQPAPYGGDFPENVRVIEPGTVPIAHVPRPPNPPSRHARPELHITPPQGMRPPPRRPSRGRVLKASRATLPLFRQTGKVMGWRAFILPHRQRMTCTEAIRAIGVYTDKSMRLICQQTGEAKSELWERARDFDLREAELRRPLNKQTGM